MFLLDLLPDNLASLSVAGGTGLFGGGALVKAWPAIKSWFGNVETKIAAAVNAVRSEVAALEAKVGQSFTGLTSQWATELNNLRGVQAKLAAQWDADKADLLSRLAAVEVAVGIAADVAQGSAQSGAQGGVQSGAQGAS